MKVEGEARSCMDIATLGASSYLHGSSRKDHAEQARLNAKRAAEMQAFLSVPTLQVTYNQG